MHIVRRTQDQPTTAQLVNRFRAGRELVAMGVVGAERTSKGLVAIIREGDGVIHFHTDYIQVRLHAPLCALARRAEAEQAAAEKQARRGHLRLV